MVVLQLLAFAFFLVVVFLATVGANVSIVCEITVPIAVWLKNNTGPCDAVKGHFILDKAANKYTREIFSTFFNLKRIEGCIYVREFTGSQNLSFFGNLEEVICPKKEAKLSHLTNVIDIVGPELKTMGFNSLKRVEGPGQIVLSYEEEPIPYFNQETIDGEQCFSKREQVFLAYHPQFRRTMYQTCETDDPCYRLDFYKMWYTVAEVPKNCSVFVGPICLVGPVEEKMFLDRFQNLTLLIGQLHVLGTLFDDLYAIFPKLENIYPYERPNMNDNDGKTCNEGTMTFYSDATQFVHVSLNRFIKNISLPALLPIRPVDVSLNLESTFVNQLHGAGVDFRSFFPETIDFCASYPRFNCGYYTNEKSEDVDWENHIWIEETWILSMASIAIGVFFSIRSMVMLQFSHASKGLPYTRSLIILVIFISTLVAVESCIFYQKIFTAFTGSENNYYIFPEFSSTFLIYLPVQWAVCFLVANRYACLAVIILCYVDIILFYRTGSYRLSLNCCALIAVLTVFLAFHLNSQLTLIIRGRRPNYSKEPRHVVFMPLIMNEDYAPNLTKFLPAEQYGKYYDGILQLSPNSDDFRLDYQALPTYSNICDALMVLVVIIFYVLTYRHVIIPHHSFTILIALYLQLSSTRIRHYLYSQILINDYCIRLDYDKRAKLLTKATCYDKFDYTDSSKWDSVTSSYRVVHDEAIMEKCHWDILEKVLEKLPYFSYAIVSFYCYIFSKYHHYFGTVVHYRETRKDKPTKTTGTKIVTEKSKQ